MRRRVRYLSLGIGRANDIPNAELITDYNQMQYVYVNNSGNDLKKIASPT